MNSGREWMLAPAYDLCYSYSPSRKWTNRHQMSINNKRDNFTLNDLLTVAKNMGIKNGHDIVKAVVDVVSQWEKYAQEACVNKEYIKQIKSTLRLRLP